MKDWQMSQSGKASRTWYQHHKIIRSRNCCFNLTLSTATNAQVRTMYFWKGNLLNLVRDRQGSIFPRHIRLLLLLPAVVKQSICNTLFLLEWLVVTKDKTWYWIIRHPSKMCYEIIVSPTVSCVFLPYSLYVYFYFSSPQMNNEWDSHGTLTCGFNTVDSGSHQPTHVSFPVLAQLSLLTGEAQWETMKDLMPCKHCSPSTKTLLCYQRWPGHRSNALHHMGCYEENELPPS